MAAPIVTLTTDFGLSDPYVAQMKAPILSIAPEARIVDLTHQIAPQAVSEAAFVLETSWRFFPEGSIHLVVVDPGVGTSRRRLVMQAQGHYFVGPDNGCLSAALPEEARGLRPAEAGYEARMVRVPAGVRAVSAERLDALPRPPSATFEGRDVFAPLAALLASGADVAGFGPPLEIIFAFAAFRGPAVSGGLDGMVIRVDRFGNLITDIRGEDLEARAAVRIAGEELPVARTYVETPGLAAIVGGSGYLEIAMRNGNAAAALASGPGTAVMVTLPA